MKKPVIILTLALSVAGCGSVGRTLGFERSSPDEYETLDLPPLNSPPNYKALPRPEEQQKSRARERAKAALVKSSGAVKKPEVDRYLLKRAGVGRNDPQIRAKLKQEDEQLQKEKTSVLSNYIPYHPDQDVLDAEAEQKRLKLLEKKVKNLEEARKEE